MEKANMKNEILIAYYSWSGNTRKIAEMIAEETGGTLFEIEPVKPYTTKYHDAVRQAKAELAANFRPELKSMPEKSSNKIVFLGTPIWWSTMAPPLATFIENFDLEGKTVIPFHTHGGGGVGTFEMDIAEMCKAANIQDGLSVLNSGSYRSKEQIRHWLESMDLQVNKVEG